MHIDEQRFMWAVQALAQPADVQLDLYPAFVEVADELELELEETKARYLRTRKDDVEPEQRAAIERLDDQLNKMSGPDKPFWTVEALQDAPEWEEVRKLAHDVIRAMGWSAEAPPRERGAIYMTTDA